MTKKVNFVYLYQICSKNQTKIMEINNFTMMVAATSQ